MFFCNRNAPLSLKGLFNLAVASQRLVIKVALVAVAKQVARARLLLIKDEEMPYHFQRISCQRINRESITFITALHELLLLSLTEALFARTRGW